MKTLKDVRTPC